MSDTTLKEGIAQLANIKLRALVTWLLLALTFAAIGYGLWDYIRREDCESTRTMRLAVGYNSTPSAHERRVCAAEDE